MAASLEKSAKVKLKMEAMKRYLFSPFFTQSQKENISSKVNKRSSCDLAFKIASLCTGMKANKRVLTNPVLTLVRVLTNKYRLTKVKALNNQLMPCMACALFSPKRLYCRA